MLHVASYCFITITIIIIIIILVVVKIPILKNLKTNVEWLEVQIVAQNECLLT